MDKDAIIEFINQRSKWYQKIRLPYGLETPGKDRYGIIDKIFPDDFKGASVLDIGCAEGFFCIEAKKRNAGKVVGLDINDERLKTANHISEILGYDISFINANITNFEELGKFDYIICLNIIHHVKDPIHVLRTLTRNTKTKIILEIADLRIKPTDIGRAFWRILFRLLPSKLKPAAFMIDTRGKTLVTSNWIKTFFNNTFTDIETLDCCSSDRKNRFIVNCYKRKIDNLRIITGPSGVGKSHLIKNSYSKDKFSENILDFNIDKSWLIINAQDLEKYKKKSLNNLLLHYDMTRPVKRGYSSYNFEPALTVLNCSNDKKSYVLFCNRKELITRTREVLGDKPTSRHIDRANFLINLYSNPDKISRIYRNWLDFCIANKCEVETLDVSGDIPKRVDIETAFSLLK